MDKRNIRRRTISSASSYNPNNELQQSNTENKSLENKEQIKHFLFNEVTRNDEAEQDKNFTAHGGSLINQHSKELPGFGSGKAIAKAVSAKESSLIKRNLPQIKEKIKDLRQTKLANPVRPKSEVYFSNRAHLELKRSRSDESINVSKSDIKRENQTTEPDFSSSANQTVAADTKDDRSIKVVVDSVKSWNTEVKLDDTDFHDVKIAAKNQTKFKCWLKRIVVGPFLFCGIILLYPPQSLSGKLSKLPNDLDCFLKTDFNATFNYARMVIMDEQDCGGGEKCFEKICNDICRNTKGSSIAVIQQDMCSCLSLQDDAQIFGISSKCCKERGKTIDGQLSKGPHGIRVYNISLSNRKINTSHAFLARNICDESTTTENVPAPLHTDDDIKKCNSAKCSMAFAEGENGHLEACTAVSNDVNDKLLNAFVRNSQKHPELCKQHCNYQSEFTHGKYEYFMVSVANFPNGKNIEMCICSEQRQFEALNFKLCSECQTNEYNQENNCSNESILVSNLIYCMNTQIEGKCCSTNEVNSVTMCDKPDSGNETEKGWFATRMTIFIVVAVLLGLFCCIYRWIEFKHNHVYSKCREGCVENGGFDIDFSSCVSVTMSSQDLDDQSAVLECSQVSETVKI